jgi:hypothetical protein
MTNDKENEQENEYTNLILHVSQSFQQFNANIAKSTRRTKNNLDILKKGQSKTELTKRSF